ncbi:hypothetical protein CPLU01_04566 [Colletotrichum plurivorum]|uniref:Uncharacterized protein n=1 Tax=Colletotrichum plurivorum TaxID=2175906 RepID=A0A8H6KQ78_9PEZI|nr:hypothetical protein CPLU01_04566 [Colletotrichum plurivorum]
MRGDGDAACDGAGSRMQDRRRCGTNSGGSASMSVGSILPSSIPRLIKHCVRDAMGKVSFSLLQLQLALTALEVMRDVENFSRREGGEGFDIVDRILDDAPTSSAHSLASAPGSADHPGPALSISLTAGGRDDG